MQDDAGADSLVGKSIGARYQLKSRIGRGGFADVFRAWDDFDDVEVAIKVLRRADKIRPDKIRLRTRSD